MARALGRNRAAGVARMRDDRFTAVHLLDGECEQRALLLIGEVHRLAEEQDAQQHRSGCPDTGPNGIGCSHGQNLEDAAEQAASFLIGDDWASGSDDEPR